MGNKKTIKEIKCLHLKEYISEVRYLNWSHTNKSVKIEPYTYSGDILIHFLYLDGYIFSASFLDLIRFSKPLHHCAEEESKKVFQT